MNNQSSTNEEYASCPHCNASQCIEPVTAVYPDSEELDSLFNGTLNRFQCSACEQKFSVKVPVLFRDEENHALVYYIPAEDRKDWQEAENQMDKVLKQVFSNLPDDELPHCRLTLTYRGFIEKTSLLMNGFDDRVIEYLKYQLFKDEQRQLDPYRTEMLYNFSQQDENYLNFLLFDRETGSSASALDVPKELYDELAESILKDEDVKNELEEMFSGYFINVEKLFGLC